MTENEAIKEIRNEVCNEKGVSKRCHDRCMYGKEKCAYSMAMAALEEIQQYRAIGTVEECREARERQMRKKVNNRKLLKDFNKTPYSVRGDCSNCGSVGLLSMNTDYCNACGQKLDWSE